MAGVDAMAQSCGISTGSRPPASPQLRGAARRIAPRTPTGPRRYSDAATDGPTELTTPRPSP
ncbi:hypothetical protein [Streptomyces sp. HC307]|uniref:hypothetical protein n=1 Tax=Streptomyces flavusporus TaxID=3385496 RepID=UPI003916DD97